MHGEQLQYYSATSNTENWKQMVPEKELRGVSPNFHIHVSVSHLYIPRIGLLLTTVHLF